MAITNTRTVSRVEVSPMGDDPSVMIVYNHTFDDSSDDALPVTSQVVKHIQRYTMTYAEDGTESSAATDVTGEDQLVQDICAAVWTD
jgi:hypothetical protein